MMKVFSEGMSRASNLRIISCSIISLALSPLGWPMIILKKAVDIFIITIFWILFHKYVEDSESIRVLVFSISFLVIFYQDIKEELTEILFHSINILTLGCIFKWICKGFHESNGMRHLFLYSHRMQHVIGIFSPLLPDAHLKLYDEIFNAFTSIDAGPMSEAILKEKLEHIDLEKATH
jgi:uncharacterized membrane protein YbaN (DUF454 family)